MVDVQLPLLQQVVDDRLVVHLPALRQVDVFQHDLLVRALRAQLALRVDVDDRVVAFLVEVQVLGQGAVLFADQQVLQVQDVAAVRRLAQREVLDGVDRRLGSGALVTQFPLEGIAAGAADEDVIALAADQDVVAVAAFQRVVARTAVQQVVAVTAVQFVVARATVDDVCLLYTSPSPRDS